MSERLHGYALPFRAVAEEFEAGISQHSIVDKYGRTIAAFDGDGTAAGEVADLMAAAPEMADALKELLCWLGSGSALSNGAKCEMLTEATDQARAALAKAGVL